jgi:hypothetical protein
MNNVEKVLKWIREVDVKSLPYNVSAIGWGPKIKNGIETGENCIIFTVKSKKSLNELKPNEIIPKELQIELGNSGENLSNIVTFKTDIKEPLICKKLLQDCHLRSNTVSPVQDHRMRRRKLMGGIESATNWGNVVGTLGIFVKDKSDGQVVALSNNHVFANSQVSAILKTPNEQGSTTTLEISGFQPTGYWITTQENDYIGKCKRAAMIGNKNPNIAGYLDVTPVISETSCDAAILSLSAYNLIDSINSPNILNFDPIAPYQFATDFEIDSLAPGGSSEGAPIFRAGRTLGPIGAPGNTYSCNLSVYELNWSLVGNYSGYYSYFSNCFYVRGNVSAGAGGDSGSAMFALFNEGNPSLSAWKLIGLLFAGPDNNLYTIGCRITEISKALNIGSWDTKIPTLSSSKMITTINNNYSQTVDLSGRTFYQVGYF